MLAPICQLRWRVIISKVILARGSTGGRKISTHERPLRCWLDDGFQREVPWAAFSPHELLRLNNVPTTDQHLILSIYKADRSICPSHRKGSGVVCVSIPNHRDITWPQLCPMDFSVVVSSYVFWNDCLHLGSFQCDYQKSRHLCKNVQLMESILKSSLMFTREIAINSKVSSVKICHHQRAQSFLRILLLQSDVCRLYCSDPALWTSKPGERSSATLLSFELNKSKK